jgi:hypothetical protein
MSITPKLRGGFYVDGFNLYHAIDDLKKPYLKWLSLRSLASRVARGHAHVVDRIVFCTAFFPGDFDKRKRHEAYNAAQIAEGVQVLLGHTTKEPMSCKACDHRWDQPREKETDINLALSIFSDVSSGRVDVVFLVTADTDQAATLRFVRRLYPAIKVVVVTPPGREKSKHLRDLSTANLALVEADLDAAVLPAMLHDPNGKLIVRPQSYAPPAGWVHPTKRP